MSWGSHEIHCWPCVQADFVFGYSVPLRDVVRRTSGGAYELNLQFSPAITGIIVRDLTIKVAPAACACSLCSHAHRSQCARLKKCSAQQAACTSMIDINQSNFVYFCPSWTG